MRRKVYLVFVVLPTAGPSQRQAPGEAADLAGPPQPHPLPVALTQKQVEGMVAKFTAQRTWEEVANGHAAAIKRQATLPPCQPDPCRGMTFTISDYRPELMDAVARVLGARKSLDGRVLSFACEFGEGGEPMKLTNSTLAYPRRNTC